LAASWSAFQRERRQRDGAGREFDVDHSRNRGAGTGQFRAPAPSLLGLAFFIRRRRSEFRIILIHSSPLAIEIARDLCDSSGANNSSGERAG
jgi:hypothetical protein